MPPTSTPAMVTPLAIRSSRELSYAYAATAPPTRARRRTATRMNHRCLMIRIPDQGTWGSGDGRPLTARLRRLDARTAPGQHGLDRAEDPGSIGVITLVVAQRDEVLVLQGGEQGD